MANVIKRAKKTTLKSMGVALLLFFGWEASRLPIPTALRQANGPVCPGKTADKPTPKLSKYEKVIILP